MQQGTDAERDEALQRLAAQAQAQPDDLAAWHEYALGLGRAGRHAEAARLFEALVEAAPETALYRRNLGVALSQLGHYQLARVQLQYVAEHSADEDERAVARQQVETLDRDFLADEQNERLAELQLAALRQRRETARIDGNGRALLVRRLLRRQPRHPDEPLIEEATTVLEEGLAESPDAVPLLELVVWCYTQLDPHNRLDAAVARLERLAPNSRVIELLGSNLKVDNAASIPPARVGELIKKVMSDDPAVRAAAVEDLGAIVAMYPDAYRRSAYACALGIVERRDEAKAQAERAAQDAGEDHATHFNIGRVLWVTGDEAAGRHHLDLAWQFARNDDDRRGVENFLASVSGHD